MELLAKKVVPSLLTRDSYTMPTPKTTNETKTTALLQELTELKHKNETLTT